MHMIMAVIQPTKLSTVREALGDLGIEDISVSDASGYGRQRGQRPSFRGNEYRVELLRKIILEFVVSDQNLEQVLSVINRSARTGADGEIGDGKIFIMPIAEVISI